MEAPETPDPYDSAAAQQNADIGAGTAAAIINNYNEKNPYANVKYKKKGYAKITDAQGNKIKVPRYTKITEFSPEQQKLFDQQMQLGASMNDLALSQVSRLGDVLGSPIDFSGAPRPNAGSFTTGQDYMDPDLDLITKATARNLPQHENISSDIRHDNLEAKDYSEDRRRVEDAIMSRWNEMYDDRVDNLDARLAAQGFSPGSEAAKSEFYDIGKWYNDAAMQAILAGGQEQTRLNDLDMSIADRNFDRTQANFENDMSLADRNFLRDQTNFGNAMDTDAFENAAYGAARGYASQDAAEANQATQWKYGTDTDAYNRYLNEILMPRNVAISEISALMGGGQPTMPSFADPYQQAIQSPDLMGFIQNNFNTESANYRQMMSGLFGLGNTALGLMG